VSVAAHPITVHLQNESVSVFSINLMLGLVLQPLAESMLDSFQYTNIFCALGSSDVSMILSTCDHLWSRGE